jgi:hypothetical protein
MNARYAHTSTGFEAVPFAAIDIGPIDVSHAENLIYSIVVPSP